MSVCKCKEEVEEALRKVEGSNRFPGMTYEQGIEEALLWVLGEIEDDDFEYY